MPKSVSVNRYGYLTHWSISNRCWCNSDDGQPKPCPCTSLRCVDAGSCTVRRSSDKDPGSRLPRKSHGLRGPKYQFCNPNTGNGSLPCTKLLGKFTAMRELISPANALGLNGYRLVTAMRLANTPAISMHAAVIGHGNSALNGQYK